jgi:molybdopterin molybdotransferase
MVVFYLFGKPILRTRSGLSREEAFRQNRTKVRAVRNIPSVAGREDYVRVRLEEKDGVLWAHPLFGKSGAIGHFAQADGLLKIGLHEEGLDEGEEAEVILL